MHNVALLMIWSYSGEIVFCIHTIWSLLIHHWAAKIEQKYVPTCLDQIFKTVENSCIVSQVYFEFSALLCNDK